MNDVEQRIQAAADETRRLAQKRLARELVVERGRIRPRGWLALAAGFAVVVVTFGLIPWLASNVGNEPIGDNSPPTAPTDTSSTVAAPTGGCSSDGVPFPAAADGLPHEVLLTRETIAGAASDCDLATLGSLGGARLRTSFGGGGVENLAIWEDQGEGQLGTLLGLLDMSYGTMPLEGGGATYVWPAAATYESWDEIPEDELAELTAIYTEGELDQLAGLPSYAGWRTGIDHEGNWLYFLAGD